MVRLRWWLPALLVSAATAFAGCGGGGGSSGAPVAVPSSLLPTPAPSPTPAPTPTPAATPTPQALNVYVENANLVGTIGFSVFSASLGGGGNQVPARTISSPTFGNLSTAGKDGFAFDAQGNLYVGAGAAIYVFAPGGSGSVSPIRTITGSNTNLSGAIPSLAFDSAGSLYALTANTVTGATAIDVFGAGASGNATPARIISGSNTLLNNPQSVAVDGQSNLYVANLTGNGSPPFVTVYGPTATGNAPPSRTIAGSNTALTGSPQFVEVAADSNGNLYAGVGYPTGNVASVLAVFPPNSNGNAVPSALIAGSAAPLTGLSGLAVDANANIYVTTFGGPSGGNGSVASVALYPAGSTGNSAPSRYVAGPNSGLVSVLGVRLCTAGSNC